MLVAGRVRDLMVIFDTPGKGDFDRTDMHKLVQKSGSLSFQNNQVFPKIGVFYPPKSSITKKGFPLFSPSVWGTIIFGNTQSS